MTALPRDAWRRHEPRIFFPVFAGVRTYWSCSLNDWFRPISLRSMRSFAAMSLRKRPTAMAVDLALEAASWVTSPWLGRLRARVHLLDWGGAYLGSHEIGAGIAPGQTIEVDIGEVRGALGLPDGRYIAIGVFSRGQLDGYRSLGTSLAMTYTDGEEVAIFRTGAFARPLNEPRVKSHVRFVGINPKVLVNAGTTSSVLLINHSSDPGYARTASPTARLVRADGREMTAPFGEIRPFGAIERSVVSLFGPEAEDFLAPFGGRGTTIVECAGTTLASIHLQRRRDARGSLVTIEHSRPPQAMFGGIQLA